MPDKREILASVMAVYASVSSAEKVIPFARMPKSARDFWLTCADQALAMMAETEWQPMDTCPARGEAWLLGGRFKEPRIVQLDGNAWYAEGGPHAPTMWAPCEPPPKPTARGSHE